MVLVGITGARQIAGLIGLGLEYAARPSHEYSTYAFDARSTYDCLISVPFNLDVATRFVKYLNDTLQFQSTLAYLKNPPPGYQQPPSDLIQGVDDIQQSIDQGAFINEYNFEVAVVKLLNSAHDTHLQLYGGILQAFVFVNQYGIVSFSSDGKALPEIYLSADVEDASSGDLTDAQISPIVQANGQDIISFLSDFATANAVGGIEPNADWNQLMESPVLDVLLQTSLFGGSARFFPGDSIIFLHENGTETEAPFFAIYTAGIDPGPLTTAGDFYNFFVLGLTPANYNSSTDSLQLTNDSALQLDDTQSWNSTGWQPAALSELEVDPDGQGYLTAYFYDDISTAIISVPSFEVYGSDALDFSTFVSDFLTNATSLGISKVLIDLQQNTGGDLLIAVDTFKQFFPNIDPYDGSRQRAHPMGDILGSTINPFWSRLSPQNNSYFSNTTSEWVATDRLNAATGQNFTSWQEFFGPNVELGDLFTNVQRSNFSSPTFVSEATDGGIGPLDSYGNNSSSPSFPPENVMLLLDGQCASACSVFAGMMQHQAGVRTVAVGGRPAYEPMQGVGGSRGARSYEVTDLDSDISLAQYLSDAASAELPDRTDQDLLISYAAVTVRDQIRQGQSTPAQFLYEPSDCRIFFTLQTVFNLENLWRYAARAMFEDPSLCVKGSRVGNDTSAAAKFDLPNAVTTNAGANKFFGFRGPVPGTTPDDAAKIPDAGSGPPLNIGGQIRQNKHTAGRNLRSGHPCAKVGEDCGVGSARGICQEVRDARFGNCVAEAAFAQPKSKNANKHPPLGGRRQQQQ